MTIQNAPQTRKLSSGQRLMWLGQRLHKGQPLYNMIYAFHIRGAIDPQRFQEAFAHVAASYDNLRTVIVEDEGEPQVRVLPEMPQPLALVDLSDRADPQAALDAWFDSHRARPYAMDRCLYDTALIKLDETWFVWYFGQHHIMMDVWSSRLIYDRMRLAYEQLSQGQTPELPDAPPYADFVDHEAQIAQTDRYQAASAYWQDELTKPTDALRFYGARDERLTTRTERQALTLDAEIMAQLEELSQQRGIRSLSRDLTFANIFTALVRAFLLRVTGAKSVRLGLPLANRSTPAFQQTFGLMLEILSAHDTIEPTASFRELVQAAAKSNFATLQHTMPGIGSAEHNRAYEVLVNSITLRFPDFAEMPTEVYWVHSGYGDSAHKLRLQIHDMSDSGQLELLFDFNTAHFDEPARDLTITHFERLLRAVLRDPDQAISTIDLLSDEEQALFLRDFNATAGDDMTEQTVIDWFEAQVKRTPDAVALHHDGRDLTYAALNAAANRLAQTLIERGAGSGVAVPVCLDHSFELVTAILAVLKAGAYYVPIDPAYPAERVRYILADLPAAPLVLTQDSYRSRFAKSASAVLTVGMEMDSAPANPQRSTTPDDLAYMIYTSGSTGQPKGVQIAHDGLSNYLAWARAQYTDGQALTFALYSSLAFDLTVTSLFLPLITGGTLRVYPPQGTHGTVIRQIFAENAVEVLKLTPSHLALVRDMDLSATRIRTLIVGGEDFKTELAQTIHRASNGKIAIYNEYGPTEATVACMLHRYQPAQDVRASVPIGRPADNMQVYILDERQQPVPTGVIGELVISGVGVARGYLNRPELSAERFICDPFNPEHRAYRTGDLARWLPSGQLVFLGRADEQVKVGGARIELGEIEAALTAHPAVKAGAVMVRSSSATSTPSAPVEHCTRCGLSSQFPGVTFDQDGVCSICTAYEGYKDKAQQYFKPMDTLVRMVDDIKARSKGDYDCIALLSGGKDSTYMLYRLVDLGLNVMTFTLDNGYISDEAKANIRRVTDALGVDHVFGETPFMNSIFVDSLRRYANVCNGCFKTIYTLAVNLAREKGISTIITGLSRGQFFETRLTEELFDSDDFDVSAIDESIARARRAYHQRDDIISRSLDVDVFREEGLLDDIQFVDFYRYCDVDLDEVYEYLSKRGGWVRPSDTGRSTNCLINDAGIYVHKQRRGFHNYELPYSWDVRLGHKKRDAALDELDDDIDVANVKRILREIGYHDALQNEADDGQARLIAYYVADTALSGAELREFLGQRLPDYMLPAQYIALETMPLNANGKIDRDALPAVTDGRAAVQAAYAPPSSELEAALVDIWQNILHLPQIGIHDDFFDLGGHSLPAIRIASRIEARYEIDLPLDVFFNHPTIAALATAIEDILVRDIEALSEEELLRLLEDDEL